VPRFTQGSRFEHHWLLLAWESDPQPLDTFLSVAVVVQHIILIFAAAHALHNTRVILRTAPVSALHHVALPQFSHRELRLLFALILAILGTIPVVVVATAGARPLRPVSAFIPCPALAPASVAIAIAPSAPISVGAFIPAT
jgi:Mn2+/Fe2+ NRAMP family transporter